MLEHFFKSLVATVSDPYQCNRITDALAAAGIKFYCKSKDVNRHNTFDQARIGTLGIKTEVLSQRCLWTKKMLIWLCTLYILCHKPGVPLRTKYSDIKRTLPPLGKRLQRLFGIRGRMICQIGRLPTNAMSFSLRLSVRQECASRPSGL